MLPTKSSDPVMECLFIGGPWDGEIHTLPRTFANRPWPVAYPGHMNFVAGIETDVLAATCRLQEVETYQPLRWIAMAPEIENWRGEAYVPQAVVDQLCRFDEWIYYSAAEYATLNPGPGTW